MQTTVLTSGDPKIKAVGLTEKGSPERLTFVSGALSCSSGKIRKSQSSPRAKFYYCVVLINSLAEIGKPVRDGLHLH